MKIVFTGPESTGKSFLSEWLCTEMNYFWVAEYARLYLEGKNLIIDRKDVEEIGKIQFEKEKFAESHYENVVCDTDLLTIIIWLEDKFGFADANIYKRWLHSNVDLYFLCMPDVPWEADPLRENPFDRDRLYEIHKSKLLHAKKPFFEVFGDWNERMEMIKKKSIELIHV